MRPWRRQSATDASPRWIKACSYADQCSTRYFVLYCGWTFDRMSRSCTSSGHRGQRAYSGLVAAEGLCTNAGKGPLVMLVKTLMSGREARRYR